MKICIFGGRDFNDYERLKREVVSYIQLYVPVEEWEDVEIVTGGARGADSLGKKFANEHNFKHKEFMAQWGTYGKAAGPIRNREMANYCDIGIGFHDGKSRGTANMITTLKKIDREVTVIEY